jgi:hypothetical protein
MHPRYQVEHLGEYAEHVILKKALVGLEMPSWQLVVFESVTYSESKHLSIVPSSGKIFRAKHVEARQRADFSSAGFRHPTTFVIVATIFAIKTTALLTACDVGAKALTVLLQTCRFLAVTARQVAFAITIGILFDPRGKCIRIAFENTTDSALPLGLLFTSVAAFNTVAPLAELAHTKAVAIQLYALGFTAIASYLRILPFWRYGMSAIRSTG